MYLLNLAEKGADGKGKIVGKINSPVIPRRNEFITTEKKIFKIIDVSYCFNDENQFCDCVIIVETFFNKKS